MEKDESESESEGLEDFIFSLHFSARRFFRTMTCPPEPCFLIVFC